VKANWLKELQGLLVISLALAAVLTVGGIILAFGEPLEVRLSATAVTGSVDSGLRAGASVVSDQMVNVVVAEPTAWQQTLWVLSNLPTQLVIMAMLALLLAIVRNARRADPFTAVTVRRLRVVAVIALIGGYLAFFAEVLASFVLSDTVMADGVMAFSEVPLYWFPVGFGLFAVAEVIQRGCALRDELETVI
jgi:DUF2975 family protein